MSGEAVVWERRRRGAAASAPSTFEELAVIAAARASSASASTRYTIAERRFAMLALPEWALEANTWWIEHIQLLIRERKIADSTVALDHLFAEVDDAGVPTGLALFLAAVNERDRRSTVIDLHDALFDAGKHDLCAMVKSWVSDYWERHEEPLLLLEEQRYREMAARAAAKLPPEPPVVLERKALNQLDKRAKTRKLAGPKEQNDENEHRQHHEKKEQRELRNAQTKARNQKRAKARANKLAA